MYTTIKKDRIKILCNSYNDLPILANVIKNKDRIQVVVYREPSITNKKHKLDKEPTTINFIVETVNLLDSELLLKGHINAIQYINYHLTPGKEFTFFCRDFRKQYLQKHNVKEYTVLCIETDTIWVCKATRYAIRVIDDIDFKVTKSYKEINHIIEKLQPDICYGTVHILDSIEKGKKVIADIDNYGPPFLAKSHKLSSLLDAAGQLYAENLKKYLLNNKNKLFSINRMHEFTNIIKVYMPSDAISLYPYPVEVYEFTDLEQLQLPKVFFEVS